jgi:hypothetical protein
MKTNVLIIILLFFLNSIQAQQKSSVELTEPVHGWRALTSKWPYPELAILVGLDATYKVNFIIDSTGKLKDLYIHSMNSYEPKEHNYYDSLFTCAITNALNTLKWNLATRNGIPICNKISMIIEYTTTTSESWTDFKLPPGNEWKKLRNINTNSRIIIDSIEVSRNAP